VFYLIAGIAIARWVDRGDRRLILALGVGLWCLATAATALATGFGSLALCRTLIGIGERFDLPKPGRMLDETIEAFSEWPALARDWHVPPELIARVASMHRFTRKN